MLVGGDAADPTDQELVRAVREGAPDVSSRAARELFGRHQQRVYAWCRRYTREHEQALDLSQEVFLIAFRSLHGYEGRAPFGGWLFTITHHACLRAVRKRGLDRDEEALLEEIADPRPDPQSVLEDEQARDTLLATIRECLDHTEQRAIWLRAVERMPVDEITSVLQLDSASGARGVLQTARRKLRAALGKRRATREGNRT